MCLPDVLRGSAVGDWFARSPRSANTPADRSKRAAQLSPGAAPPALCLLALGRWGDAVHGMGDLVYGDNDYDVRGQERGAYFCRLKRIDAGPFGDSVSCVSKVAIVWAGR